MGLDYSYLLYFKRAHTWDVLQAVVEMAVPHTPLTRVVFPTRELLVPLDTWGSNERQLRHDDPTLDFNFALYFEEDEPIRDWRRRLYSGLPDERPPQAREGNRVPVGTIYLTIHNSHSEWFAEGNPDNLAVFNFGTTGTRMSLLFDESESIRRTFLALLEQLPGVCGVFNREDSGEVFWLEGQPLDARIENPFLLPHQIKALLNL